MALKIAIASWNPPQFPLQTCKCVYVVNRVELQAARQKLAVKFSSNVDVAVVSCGAADNIVVHVLPSRDAAGMALKIAIASWNPPRFADALRLETPACRDRARWNTDPAAP